MKSKQETLRYRHMVANMRHQPLYKREAALLKEIAAGRQWRMEAALEAMDAGVSLDSVVAQAALFGRQQLLEKICTVQAAPEQTVNVSTSCLNSALDISILHGHYRTADTLYQHGARLEGTSLAFDVAMQEKNTRKLFQLLKNGLPLDEVILRAAVSQNQKVLAWLDQQHGGEDRYWERLLKAVEANDTQAAQALLKGRPMASPNSKNIIFAMYEAVERRNIDIIVALVEAGARPTSHDVSHARFLRDEVVADYFSAMIQKQAPAKIPAPKA